MGSCSLLQGNLLNPGNEPRPPTLQADSLPSEPPGKPNNTVVGSCPFSRVSSWPRNQTGVFSIAGAFFTNWATREAHWADTRLLNLNQKQHTHQNSIGGERIWHCKSEMTQETAVSLCTGIVSVHLRLKNVLQLIKFLNEKLCCLVILNFRYFRFHWERNYHATTFYDFNFMEKFIKDSLKFLRAFL